MPPSRSLPLARLRCCSRFLQGPDTDPEHIRMLRESVQKGTPVTVRMLNCEFSTMAAGVEGAAVVTSQQRQLLTMQQQQQRRRQTGSKPLAAPAPPLFPGPL